MMAKMKLASVTAVPLQASFAAIYGGEDKIPSHIRTPAAHFRRIPRLGQFTTLVIAESMDGAVGYGECFGLPHPLAASALVEHVIAPALVGSDIDDPVAMTADLRHYFFSMGHTRGAAMEALSGVDIALWDLKARAAGLPLATLLGASPGPVATYVSPIPFRQNPDESAADARAYIEEGYVAFKLKIGRGIETDLSHIDAVRRAIGPNAPLYLDVNCGYDLKTAIALAKELPPFDIGWLEEPIVPDDPAAMAEIRRASPVPIAAGENDFTLHSFEVMAAAGAVDFLQCNISRAGGVSGLLAVGEICARHGLKLAPHGVGSCVSVAAAVHACRAAKAFHAYEANRLINPLRDEMGVHRMELKDGCLVAADRPGHGGEPNPAILDQYRMARAA
jgi:L-alanine-DL-glutamate epimerase-like enolase superfamily enzyme